MKDEDRVRWLSADRVAVSDMNVAALLLAAAGCSLSALLPTTQPRRKTFVLSGDMGRARELLDRYATRPVSVDLDAFLAAQRQLRDRLFRADRLLP